MKAVGPLVAWTLLLWVTRIRNAWTDDDLTSGGRAIAVLVAGTFVAAAVVTGVLVVRVGFSTMVRNVVGVFALGTIVFWCIRGVQIALADHSVSFIVVHLVLGGGSVIFAVLALGGIRTETPRSRAESGGKSRGKSQ